MSQPKKRRRPLRDRGGGRGLMLWGEGREHGYSHTFEVSDSSIATKRCCWIFIRGENDGRRGDPSLHLDENGAREMRDALDAWLAAPHEEPRS